MSNQTKPPGTALAATAPAAEPTCAQCKVPAIAHSITDARIPFCARCLIKLAEERLECVKCDDCGVIYQRSGGALCRCGRDRLKAKLPPPGTPAGGEGAKWTDETPTVPGWYWWRPSDEHSYSVQEVREIDGKLWLTLGGSDYKQELGRLGGEWSGPLSPPGTPAAGGAGEGGK